MFKPRVTDSLRPILREIGVPEKTPFSPDPFQVEALKRLENEDVIVSAPTGSGKTYIAVETMAGYLNDNKKCWYASPLKALSNSKYIEFSNRFGSENVGLLTGDHKVNPDAPIIVGTTEILRNQLYDAMSSGLGLDADLIVMDEAHYLGDPDRGVVWEEILIYLPSRVRLLLLSATIANANEIADWLTYIRKQKAVAVITHERPVPLHPLFLFPDGLLAPLNKGRRLSPPVRRFVDQNRPRGRRVGGNDVPYGRILRVLGEADLLPAIFFMKSRSDCDQALSRARAAGDYMSPELKARLAKRLSELHDKYPFLKDHAHNKHILSSGVAAHHAGHMPHWKLLVEQLMQEGLLNAIFSTSTVAAGVNFPARTVIISQSDRYNGREFLDLTSTELLQMTGRAGRRGMDNVGFALVIPGPFQNISLLSSLFKADPDPVESRIQINFSMVLNLLMSHSPEQVKTMLDLSLAAYQQGRSARAGQLIELMEELWRDINQGACDTSEHALSLFQDMRRLKNELRKLNRERPALAWKKAIKNGLIPGRLFELHGGQHYCVLEVREHRGRTGVVAARVRDDLGLKKGQVRQKWIPLGRVFGLLDANIDITDDAKPAEIAAMIRDAAWEEHRLIGPDEILSQNSDPRIEAMDRRISERTAQLANLPCHDCPIHDQCLGDVDGKIYQTLERIFRLDAESRVSGRQLWTSFIRHLDFLKMEDFVGPDDSLTDDGVWAARLRLDHPLLIGAGIRAGAWPENDPYLLAAVIAPFVVDRELDPEPPVRYLPPKLIGKWMPLRNAIDPLIKRLTDAGFSTPLLNLRSAQAIYTWAVLDDWDEAIKLYGQDPGDMAMLVFRTADNLRQMAALGDSHPQLAAAAREAVGLIMKEPVITPL